MAPGPEIRVPYIDLEAQHRPLKAELVAALEGVLETGQFILGPEVVSFEAEFAKLCGTGFAVGVDNGTSALTLTLKALGIGEGDEVIVPPNPFLASASSIALVGARPVFVDTRPDLNIDPSLVEAAITSRTKALMVVHLTGRPADMDPLGKIAQRHGVYLIEDAAQAVGAAYRGKPVGGFGIAGCFSLHPMKTLNAIGDGGVIVTDDGALAERLRSARNHGFRDRDTCDFFSSNCRLDALQAAFLNAKFKHLEAWTTARRANAAYYSERLAEVVDVPIDLEHEFAVYHAYMIQADQRDELQAYLRDRGIETLVHHPIPIHLQPAAAYLGYEPGDLPVTERQCERLLSLPAHPELTPDQISYVSDMIIEFYTKEIN